MNRDSRPSRRRTARPNARRRREPLSDLGPQPDPWSLDALVSEIEERVAEHGRIHPDDPIEHGLYAILDSWAADREGTWRRDRRAEGLPVIDEPACAIGCDHCCYQHVAVTPIEAEVLAREVRDRWSDEQRQELRARLDRDVERLDAVEAGAGTPDDRRAALGRLRRPCPMLDEALGQCRAYEARPINCRRENSVDAEVCRRYRLDPEATESSLRLVRLDLIWGAAHVVLARWSADRPGTPPGADPDAVADLTEPIERALARHFV